jgi:hypothetical protein
VPGDRFQGRMNEAVESRVRVLVGTAQRRQ